MGKRLARSFPTERAVQCSVVPAIRGEAILDEALVLRFDAPASSTGEDSWNFNAMAGARSSMRSCGAFVLDGLRPAQPGEFTRRAFENGRIDLTEAEGLADLIEAETESQRKAALAMAEGG